MSNQNVGHGMTVVFGTSGFQAHVKFSKFTIGGVEVARVSTTHHGLAAPGTNVEGNDTAIPGRVHRLAPIMCTVQYDPSAGKIPTIGTIETITFTWREGQTYSGSGWIGKRGDIAVESDGLVECEITIERTAGWTVA